MRKHLHHIHIYILLGAIFLVFLLILINLETEKLSLYNQTTFGVSFTPSYAKDLRLDPRKTYLSILTDLRVANLRLSAYWDEIEIQKDKFDFNDLDWYIEEASKNKAQVILAIGYKLPRWPECRAPGWLDQSLLRDKQLNMLQAVISHYENHPTITAWQLENEPLLNFGDCPKVDREFLSKEVAFVKERTKKPVIITDSGELRPWKTPMELSDIFGTTLYRVVDTPWLGPFQYPLRPWFYKLKSDLIRKLFAPNNQKTIISELQAEPWVTEAITNVAIEEQLNRFSLNRFRETVDFAGKTSFPEAYLWGTEWWYYLSSQGHPEYLNFAKTLF